MLENLKDPNTGKLKTWVWIAGGGGALAVVFLLMNRSSDSGTAISGGQSSDLTGSLGDLESLIQQMLGNQSGTDNTGTDTGTGTGNGSGGGGTTTNPGDNGLGGNSNNGGTTPLFPPGTTGPSQFVNGVTQQIYNDTNVPVNTTMYPDVAARALARIANATGGVSAQSGNVDATTEGQFATLQEQLAGGNQYIAGGLLAAFPGASNPFGFDPNRLARAQESLATIRNPNILPLDMITRLSQTEQNVMNVTPAPVTPAPISRGGPVTR